MNPIIMRPWYSRIVDDENFGIFLKQLLDMGTEKLCIIDTGSNSDNFHWAEKTFEERIPVLTRRIAQLKENGISAGINSCATIGHGDDFTGGERLIDLDWFVGIDGRPVVGIACPIGEKFRSYLDRYFGALASTGAREIFIDDDLRFYNHPPADARYGCLCPIHMERFNSEYGYDLTREKLVKMLETFDDGAQKVQRDWTDFIKVQFLDILRRIERVVHGADKDIRLGLMSVQNFSHHLGMDYLKKAVEIVSVANRPLLRTHDYHGLPHELTPGSGIHVRVSLPEDVDHWVELENVACNSHDFVRSPRTTRFAVLSALATGMGGVLIDPLGDTREPMAWEDRYIGMLAENKDFFQKVAEICGTGAVMRGVPIHNERYNRKEYVLNSRTNGKVFEGQHCEPDLLARVLGFAYEFDEESPVLVCGDLPLWMEPAALKRSLGRGAIVDRTAAQHLLKMDGEYLPGIEMGGRLNYSRVHLFLDHPLNGEFRNHRNSIRFGSRIHRLSYDPEKYEEVTSIVTPYSHSRVGAGIIVSTDSKSRLVVLPHNLSPEWPIISMVSIRAYRYLLYKLMAWTMRRPLPVYVEGPPHISPFYFEREKEGLAVVSLLNGYYEDLYDFSLVFGDERLVGKPVGVIDSNGNVVRQPNLVIRERDGQYVLPIGKEDLLPNCDVKVLVIGEGTGTL